MSKKTFKGGLDTLLGDREDKPKVGRPKTQFKEITKTSQEGTKENETRATFILREDLLEKVKALAHWERKLIKDVVNEALEDAINKYENKNGVIQPKPKR